MNKRLLKTYVIIVFLTIILFPITSYRLGLAYYSSTSPLHYGQIAPSINVVGAGYALSTGLGSVYSGISGGAGISVYGLGGIVALGKTGMPGSGLGGWSGTGTSGLTPGGSGNKWGISGGLNNYVNPTPIPIPPVVTTAVQPIPPNIVPVPPLIPVAPTVVNPTNIPPTLIIPTLIDQGFQNTVNPTPPPPLEIPIQRQITNYNDIRCMGIYAPRDPYNFALVNSFFMGGVYTGAITQTEGNITNITRPIIQSPVMAVPKAVADLNSLRYSPASVNNNFIISSPYVTIYGPNGELLSGQRQAEALAAVSLGTTAALLNAGLSPLLLPQYSVYPPIWVPPVIGMPMIPRALSLPRVVPWLLPRVVTFGFF